MPDDPISIPPDMPAVNRGHRAAMLSHLLSIQARVRIWNPRYPADEAWTGRMAGLLDEPGIILERDDGKRTILPQSFAVEELPAHRVPLGQPFPADGLWRFRAHGQRLTDDPADSREIRAVSGDPSTPHAVDLAAIARDLQAALEANRANGLTEGNALDVTALTLAEEAGELVGAYRRWSGHARRSGTLDDLALEVGDVLIVTAIFAHLAGIDLNAAVRAKLKVIYSRGWKEQEAGR